MMAILPHVHQDDADRSTWAFFPITSNVQDEGEEGEEGEEGINQQILRLLRSWCALQLPQPIPYLATCMDLFSSVPYASG